MSSNYAEKNEQYIFDALEKLSAPNRLDVYDYDYVKTIPDKPGIYMFFIYSWKTEKRYPVYFGKTESFRTRMLGHKHDGVIERYLSGTSPTIPQTEEREQDLLLKVVLVPLLPPFNINLAESVFLRAFDFALNKMENGKERNEISGIDQTKPDKSAENMRGVLENMNEGILQLQYALR